MRSSERPVVCGFGGSPAMLAAMVFACLPANRLNVTANLAIDGNAIPQCGNACNICGERFGLHVNAVVPGQPSALRQLVGRLQTSCQDDVVNRQRLPTVLVGSLLLDGVIQIASVFASSLMFSRSAQ